LLHNIIFTAFIILNQGWSVDVKGNVFFSSQYLLTSRSSVRNQREAERLISSILDKYNNAGFPFCKIVPDIAVQEDSSSNVTLTVEEGTRVVIEDLLIKTDGNTYTNAAKRIAHFRINEYFSLKNVVTAKKRLEKTKAFEGIADNILNRDGKYYLLFTLLEKESDFLTVSGSFSGTDLQFGASYSSFSLLGTLRQLSFDYEYQRLFSLNFREPVLIAPAIIDAQFAIRTYDSTRQIDGNIKFSAPIGAYFTVSLLSGIELVNYYGADTVTTQTSDNLLGFGIGFEYEMTDWSIFQNINLSYLFRDADRLRMEYDAEVEFKKIFVGFHYHMVRTDSFELIDYVRIGGAKNLRGYLEDEFLFKRAAWVNFEYHRFPIFPLIDIARLGKNVFYSYGFGIRAKSKIVDASMILAWPKEGTWEDGKVHLVLSRGF